MGKSFTLVAFIFQLLTRRVPLVAVDEKGELAALLRETVVPALVAQGRSDLVDQIRIVDPFDPTRVPLLRLTQAEPRVSPRIQSLNIATALGEAVGHSHGVRMQRALLPTVGLAVERNLPLPVILDWLRDPQRFARDAASSSDGAIRAYAIHELPRENRSSLDAMRARLDLVFHLDEVRAALSAPSCIDFHTCLDRGLTVFDFGTAPGGAEEAMRFIAAPILGRLSRAILSRDVAASTPSCVVLFEEFQELLGHHQVEQFKRLLSLCRFKRVALWFSTQSAARVAAVDPTLLKVLRTNLGAEMIFRSSIEDARVLSEGLTAGSKDESMSQARARFIQEMASLPRRECFLWLKSEGFGPQRLRSPRVDMETLSRLAAQLPPEVRQQIRTGVASMDRAELEQAIAAESKADTRQPLIGPLDEDRRARAPRLG
jgi:hypothetical protein